METQQDTIIPSAANDASKMRDRFIPFFRLEGEIVQRAGRHFNFKCRFLVENTAWTRIWASDENGFNLFKVGELSGENPA